MVIGQGRAKLCENRGVPNPGKGVLQSFKHAGREVLLEFFVRLWPVL